MNQHRTTSISLQVTEDTINKDIKITCLDDSLDRIHKYVSRVNSTWSTSTLIIHVMPISPILTTTWEIPGSTKVVKDSDTYWSLPINVRTSMQPIMLRFDPGILRLKIVLFREWMELKTEFTYRWIQDVDGLVKKLIVTRK